MEGEEKKHLCWDRFSTLFNIEYVGIHPIIIIVSPLSWSEKYDSSEL